MNAAYLLLYTFVLLCLVLLLRSFVTALFPGKRSNKVNNACKLDNIENSELFEMFNR